MLPIVFVLFVVSSAFAAPSVTINQVPIQETSVPYDTGYGFNAGLAAKLLELVDGGDANIYILYLEQVLEDLANQRDSYSQALAVSQILAILGEIGYGVPGNSCAAANAINQYVSGSGCHSYLSSLANAIDTVAALSSNPASIRYSQSPSGNCAGNGRTYQFESAWSGILAAATPYNIGLVNEEYCSAKRLYQAYNVRSNNVAAAATAASLPPVVETIQRNFIPILNFLIAAANGNGYSLAASAKNAILS